MLEKIKGFLRSLDPKLVSTVVTTGMTRAVLELGGDPVGDPFWNGVISLAVGAVVGFIWPNDGTVLRTPQESGNADPAAAPAGVSERGQVTPAGIAVGAILALLVLVAIAVL